VGGELKLAHRERRGIGIYTTVNTTSVGNGSSVGERRFSTERAADLNWKL